MKSPTAFPVFYRTYSRFIDGKREDWAQVTDRVVGGLIEIGDLTPEEAVLLTEQQLLLRALPSGRMLWVGGTEWSKKPENFPGSYNCSSTNVDSFDAMASLMNLAMMGCGTGANLERQYVDKLPLIATTINLSITDAKVDNSKGFVHPKVAKWEKEYTSIDIFNDGRHKSILIKVGDSRKGWVDAYQELLLIASAGYGEIDVVVDLSRVRPTGQKLKGFGGVANPIRLPDLFINVAKVTNSAVGRKLTPTDCAKIIGSAAMAVVAGNIRRSAGINQFDSSDTEAITSKDDLWVETDGVWSIDPDRDMLRLANHTIVYHKKPTLEECIVSVTKQYYSGEGAIMWAGEAVARANADILNTGKLKKEFLANYPESADSLTVEQAGRYGLNPCLGAGTMVLTRAGHFPIEELVGKTVEVWDGDQWIVVDNFRVTGTDQKVISIELSTGDVIVATPRHRFCLAGGAKVYGLELKVGDILKTHSISPGGMHTNRSQRPIKVLGIESAGVADKVYCCTVKTTHNFALSCGIMIGQCGEIVLSNNFCNLSEVHLNNLDPSDLAAQQKAFTAAGLSVAVLLNHKFTDSRYQASREADPVVGVSFTGLFDFFVAAFGIEWLEWWQAGRPKKWGVEIMLGKWQSDYFTDREQDCLQLWRGWATNAVTDYCQRHGLKVPNRCTAVQPAGSKSLLTGASCGFHPPKAARYIRRITFAKNDPVALACIDYGYTVVPSQSDKDLDGNLLDDPHSDLCTEWLVEIPVSVSWADLPGVDNIDISKFSALAQFDFAMQVQKHYVTHNLSATIELREDEIVDLATAIHGNIQADGGYISAALLARFDSLQTFPRLPFEPIDRNTYLRLSQQVLERRTRDFKEALDYYDSLDSTSAEALSGAAGCDGDKCLMPEKH